MVETRRKRAARAVDAGVEVEGARSRPRVARGRALKLATLKLATLKLATLKHEPRRDEVGSRPSVDALTLGAADARRPFTTQLHDASRQEQAFRHLAKMLDTASKKKDVGPLASNTEPMVSAAQRVFERDSAAWPFEQATPAVTRRLSSAQRRSGVAA